MTAGRAETPWASIVTQDQTHGTERFKVELSDALQRTWLCGYLDRR